MKYIPLIWSGLWRVPIRTGLTFFSIVLAFVLFGILTSLAENFDAAAHAARKNVMAMYADVSGPPEDDMPRGMPISHMNQIQQTPGVASVLRWGELDLKYQGDDKNRFPDWPVNAFEIAKFYPEINVRPGAWKELAETPTGMVVEKKLADKFGWKVGDVIPLESQTAKKDGTKVWTFTVVSIYEAPRWIGIEYSIISNFDYFDRERQKGEGIAAEYDITVGDPEQTASIAKQLDAMFANSGVPTRTRPFWQDGQNSEFDVKFFARAVVGSGFVMLLMLCSTAMMEAIGERTPELAVLRSMGFSPEKILGLIIAEAFVPALVGAGIGLGIARIAIPYAGKNIFLFHDMAVHVPWTVVVGGIALSVAVALVSSALPAWRAARLNIVDALSDR